MEPDLVRARTRTACPTGEGGVETDASSGGFGHALLVSAGVPAVTIGGAAPARAKWNKLAVDGAEEPKVVERLMRPGGESVSTRSLNVSGAPERRAA